MTYKVSYKDSSGRILVHVIEGALNIIDAINKTLTECSITPENIYTAWRA